MEEYIHLQNLILFRKRLAEFNDESKRTVLLKLLTEEEARDASFGTSPCPVAPHAADQNV
ncbi:MULTISPECIES: hypothetical protein [unclassified Bradyrhizobium]|uniref:hypothetical protein n=1 Tax=Bradyrhizobium TaxID=374 RepID=UPI0028E4F580|nr:MULTISPECIES: hypothetical protein [unclassified Bradyrhizobium]